MKLTKMNIVRASLLASLALTGAVGCATDGSQPKDFFPPADGHRRTEELSKAQAKAGAREDATLNAIHFTGTQLNSLGECKLDMLMPDEVDSDVVVYVALADGDQTIARRDSVRVYLKDHGVEPSRVKLESGANPHTNHPAAQGLTGLAKLENATTGGDATSGGESSSSGGSMK